MKKLLNLIGALTLVGTAATPVIACSSKTAIKSDGQKAADAIKNKIQSINVDLDPTTNPSTTNSVTITAIKTALKANNPWLTGTPTGSTGDLSKITFNAVTLKLGSAVSVVAIVKVDTAIATKTLNVRLAQTDHQAANAIKEKITDINVTVPEGTPLFTDNLQTVTAMKTALKAVNRTLTTADLSKITFGLTTLSKGMRVELFVYITVGSARAVSYLGVTLAQTDQQKANAIKDKITDTTLTVPVGTNPSTANSQTVTTIKTSLKADNQTLNTADLAKITFNTVNLLGGQATNVTATITVGTATATQTLNVTLAQTDQQKANAIKNKITDVNLAVPAGTNPSTANPQTVTAIETSLKADNQTLTTADLTKIAFNNTTLVDGQAINVTAAITVGRANARKILNVTLLQTNQQKANAIKNKITDTVLTLPVGTDPSTGNSQTITAIKNALKTDNQTLTTVDLTKITFNTVNLIFGPATHVTATITVGSATATQTLNVTLAQRQWIQSTTIPTDANIETAPVLIDGTYYLSTYGSGIYSSSDGSTWTQAHGRISTTVINAAPVKIGSTYYVVTQGQGLWTGNDGTTWTQDTGPRSIPTNANIQAAPVRIGSTYYLGTNDGLYTSTNGSTWGRSSQRGLPTDIQVRVAPVKIGNTYYLSTYGNGLYTSSDGTRWRQNRSVAVSAYVTSVPVEINGTYYLSTYGQGLYTSSDGSAWTRAAASGISTTAQIYAAPVKIGSTYYLSTGSGLYKSTDGSTWTQLPTSSGIPTDADIRVAPVKIGNTYYLSTYGRGLYISTNGSSWIQSISIPTNASMLSAPVKINNIYLLGTRGQGLYTS